ncbi:MAG: hypothetical protein R6X34_13935 [Chloroflexota bacterium]
MDPQSKFILVHVQGVRDESLIQERPFRYPEESRLAETWGAPPAPPETTLGSAAARPSRFRRPSAL